MHHYCVFNKEWNGCGHGHGPYNTSYIAFHPHQADLGTMPTLGEIQKNMKRRKPTNAKTKGGGGWG